MRRPGVVGNPRSRANRADAGAAVRARAAGLPYAEPDTPDALLDALRGFAREGVDLVVVNGGDGTLREVLTALPHAYAAPPAVAVLAAGKVNLAARVLGSAGRGPAALGRLLDAAARGALRARECPVLDVERLDAERPGDGPPDGGAPDGGPPNAGWGRAAPLRGLLLGAAAFAEGNRLAEAQVHRRGVHGAAAVGLTVAALVARALLGGQDPGTPMRVIADGAPLPEGRRALLLASTLDRLVGGVRPFWGGGTGPVRWLDVAAPARRVPAAVLAALRGRHGAWLAGAGYRSGRAGRVRVLLDRPFVLDGERFDPGPGGILLSAPGRVAFVAPG